MTDRTLQLVADYAAAGDQPQAIAQLVDGLTERAREADAARRHGQRARRSRWHRVISTVQRPTLILAHNKTLAAQLYGEMREFFPHNAVEYFVSYYDYYQPEAYVPSSDTYIEKDASINAAHRADAAVGDEGGARAPRRRDRRDGVRDLRPRRPRGVPRHGAAPGARHADRPARFACAA